MASYSRIHNICMLILIGVISFFPFFGMVKAQSSSEEWSIKLVMPEEDYAKMKRKSGTEFYFTPDSLLINGQFAAAKELHTRGKTTLHYWRKSYSVKLNEAFPFPGESGVKEMKRFYLISMSLDRHYFHNRLAFGCLEELGLFSLYYHYTELVINGRSEGLYLVVQRPADYALDDLGSPAIIRRKSTDFIAKEKYSKSSANQIKYLCRENFKAINRADTKWEGVKLYENLQTYLDLNHYYDWLIFNFFVNNGDYTDELFYYLITNQTNTRFDIIPWDFDDIMVKQPHEGLELRNFRLDDQLIFSSEDKLDRIIANDPYLYQKYLLRFEEVYKILNPSKLESIVQQIKSELKPYLKQEDILEVSHHDLKPTLSWLVCDSKLDSTLKYLKDRRSETLRIVKKQMKEYK